MKFLDLFAGIGGFRMGLEQAGHECIGFVEWDKHARKSYEAIYDTEGEWTAHDITAVTNDQIRAIGPCDLITGGFPCQAFSVAGRGGGFDDTRGTMFFQIARIAEQIQPRVLLLENVKGLLSHDQGRTFATILTALDELGYDAEWQICNSKDFGVPQHRERVFIVGHLRGQPGREILPVGRKNGNAINTIGHIDPDGFRQINEVLDQEGISTALRTFQGGGLQPKILTLDNKVRKLTPKECFRLQGFPDWAFDRAQAVNSDSQLYKQAGNSVTVNVVRAIGQKIKEVYQ